MLHRSIVIPRHIVCHVTKQIYLDPVTISTGHVYEKDVVDRLIADAKAKKTLPLCPLSNQPFNEHVDQYYVTAWPIKWAVADFLEKNPDARFEQYQSQSIHTPPPLLHIDPTRELEHARIEAESRAERERHSIAAFREQKEREQQLKQEAARERAIQSIKSMPKPSAQLTNQEENECKTLTTDIQNIIYALGFEKGPIPQGRIDNFSLLFFALIEQFFLKPLPWQTIEVNKKGPTVPAMYDVLKAAIRALQELNPEILNEAKKEHDGQYDRVQTLLGGKKSLRKDGYAYVARFFGTIKNQPGYYVDQMVTRADRLLADLCHQYSIEERQNIKRLS